MYQQRELKRSSHRKECFLPPLHCKANQIVINAQNMPKKYKSVFTCILTGTIVTRARFSSGCWWSSCSPCLHAAAMLPLSILFCSSKSPRTQWLSVGVAKFHDTGMLLSFLRNIEAVRHIPVITNKRASIRSLSVETLFRLNSRFLILFY